MLPLKKIGVSKMFLKEATFAHQRFIYLIKNTVKFWNILQFKITVFYVNIF